MEEEEEEVGPRSFEQSTPPLRERERERERERQVLKQLRGGGGEMDVAGHVISQASFSNSFRPPPPPSSPRPRNQTNNQRSKELRERKGEVPHAQCTHTRIPADITTRKCAVRKTGARRRRGGGGLVDVVRPSSLGGLRVDWILLPAFVSH